MEFNYKGRVKKYIFFIFIIICITAPVVLFEERFFIKQSRPVRLVFVGDIMLSRSIGTLIDKTSPEYPFELIAQRIQDADIAFGNLENPVSLQGLNQGSIYSFRAHPKTLSGLVFSGFDIVSVANNHMFDWGRDAFIDTLTYLKSYGIEFVGGGLNQEEAHAFKSIKVNKENFCFLAFSEFSLRIPKEESPGMAYLDQKRVIESIQSAKNHGCQAVVVSIHWGNEYEVFASEYQKTLARSFIDAGALLIIGHHPHVLQEIEKYNEGLIAYSLGNFIFDQNFSEDTRRSAVLEVSVSEGNVLTHKLVPIRFTKDFRPYKEGSPEL